MSLDIQQLLTAIENEKNEAILDLNKTKISAVKNDILQQLHINKEELKLLHQKLKAYRYVDNIDDINYGSYIRWIPLKDPNHIKLTNGGIICDMTAKNEQVNIKCKNRMNHCFTIKLDENLIFQKLTPQEEVILSAMNYLNK